MKLLLSLLMSSLLAACATDPTLVGRAPSITVEVPVAVLCIDAKDLPPVPPKTMLPSAGLRQRVAALLADLDAFELYAAQADVILRACATK